MIDYQFTFKEGREILFQVNMDRAYTTELDEEPHDAWTLLEHEQCSLCPLGNDTFTHCPAAVDLERVVQEFSNISSSDQVMVKVTTPDRTFIRDCDVQTGLNAVVGLVMASSGCPVLSRLRSLGRFHLPFATIEETLYRTVGDYLIKQYLIQQEGGSPDFSLTGLDDLYEDLEEVNQSFCLRISEAAKKDATLNVISNLNALSSVIRFSIGEQLKNFRSMMAL